MRAAVISCAVITAVLGGAGCHSLFKLSDVPDPISDDAGVDGGLPVDAGQLPVVCIDEPFDDVQTPPWTVWGDASVTITTVTSQLWISLPSYQSGGGKAPYGGLSSEAYDLDGVAASMEVVTRPSGAAELELQISTINTANYRISIGTTIECIVDDGNTKTSFGSRTFTSMDRFLQLREENGVMFCEHRAQATDAWAVFGMGPASVPLEGALLEVYAGTYATNAQTTAVIDTVRLTAPACL